MIIQGMQSASVPRVDDDSLELPDVIDPSMAEVDLSSASQAGAEPNPLPLLPPEIPHTDNLAKYLSDIERARLVKDLDKQFTDDLATRAEWDSTRAAGIDLLGLTLKGPLSKPFEGACSVTDPVVTEALIRYQSNAILEIFDPNGPVKQKVWGEETKERLEVAERKSKHINYLLISRMNGYREATEKLLWELGFSGAAFRKIYPDPETGLPTPVNFPPEDVVIPYGYSGINTAPRFAVIHRFDHEELRRLQLSGVYLDVPGMVKPVADVQSTYRDEKDRMAQESPTIMDGRYRVIEVTCRLNLPGFDDPDGFASPYVVTYEQTNQKLLSIRRNWKESDPFKRSLKHYVQYSWLVGPGSYGYGLIHLVGNLAKAVTLALRGLLDAASLENVSGGLKDSSLRTTEGDVKIRPFEWVNVDVGPTKTLRDSLWQIPAKGPSQVLAGLRTEIRNQIKELCSIADPMNGATNGEIPTGTLLAMIQHKVKTMTAMMARLHSSLREEFSIIERIEKDRLESLIEPDEEDRLFGVTPNDFSMQMTSEPVSDLNMSSKMEQIMQLQTLIASAQQAPQGIYDLAEMHRDLASQLVGFQKAQRIVPDRSFVPPMDGPTMIKALMEGSPVRIYPWQDHQSLIAVLMAFLQSPKRAGDLGAMPPPQQSSIQAAFMSTVAELVAHVNHKRLSEELGYPLPPLGEPIPAEIMIQHEALNAEAQRRLLDKDKAEAEMAERQKQMEDPVLQMQKAELEIKRATAQANAQNDAKKIENEAQAKAAREETERMRIAAQAENNRQKLLMEMAWLRDEMRKTNPDIALMNAKVAQILSEIGKEEPNGRTGKDSPANE